MPPDVMDRAAQMFPKLTPAQVERISSIGQRRTVSAGELLYDVGDQNTRFFVVLSGSIDVVRLIGDREEPMLAHGANEFTGEINMLSARRSLVRARAAVDGEVIAVDRDDLRTLVQRDSELSEILMRAFILRRVALMAQETNDLVLLGSRHSGSTQRIREFLSRNGQPFTYQDVETDPAVQVLLDRFHVGVDEVPVVLCRGGHVLKNPTIEMLASVARPERRPRRGEGARRGDRRRRAGRPRRRGLRRLRRAGRARPREQRAGRSGRHQLAHRELPRLPDRHLRPGAGRPGADPGREVRRRGGDRPHRGPPRLRQPALSAQPGRRAGGAHAHHRHRHRGAVPEARPAVARRASRARASTTARPTSRASSARARRSPSSAGRTRPARRRCSWREPPRASTCWCAGPAWPTACRAT